jgi:hypothetical protein
MQTVWATPRSRAMWRARTVVLVCPALVMPNTKCFMSRTQACGPPNYEARWPPAEREEDGELTMARVLFLTADGRNFARLVFQNRIDEALFFIVKACQSPLVCRLLAAPYA